MSAKLTKNSWPHWRSLARRVRPATSVQRAETMPSSIFGSWGRRRALVPVFANAAAILANVSALNCRFTRTISRAPPHSHRLTRRFLPSRLTRTVSCAQSHPDNLNHTVSTNPS
ncbi:hypothetical protein MTO96_003447 [Rhipicephalus appendiculatus]